MPIKLRARSASADVAGKSGYSLISREKFGQLYTALLKYELLEERLACRSANNAGGAQSLMAAAVGVMLDLERDDTVVLTPRTFAANLMKGVPLGTLVNHRSANGATSTATFSFDAANALTPASSAASAQASVATGAALANKLTKNGKIAVAFVDGGTTALEECREALEVASKHKLPIVYVIQARANRMHDRALAKVSELLPVITVDGHDVVAVYRVAQESIARARGGDPALIACLPYTLNGTGSSAITNMENYLTGRKLFNNKWKDETIAEFTAALNAACLPQSDPLA